MAYYADVVTFVGSESISGRTTIRARTTRLTSPVQLYISGSLSAWQYPHAGMVEFAVPTLRKTDLLFLLSVDPANAETDYFSDAFPTAAAYGNRIKVQTPQLMQGFLPDDKWSVYLGAAGAVSATTLYHTQRFYPRGLYCGGYGLGYGTGGYGFDGSSAKGYGYNYGYGEYGYDCDMLTWLSAPLPPGTYPVKVVVTDIHGNESTAATDSVVIATYPRPAKDLAIDSYTLGTDTIAFTWTASADIT